MRTVRLALAALLPLVVVGPRPARALTQEETRDLVSAYRKARHWPHKGLILCALGPRWHPCGAAMVTAALKDPRIEVRACALEALVATDADFFRRIAARPLIEALLRIKGIEREYVTRRVTSLLRRLAPGGLVQHLDQGRAWWKGVKRTYRPQPWPPPNLPRARKRERRTVAYPRRVDFDKTGIDVMFVIDSSVSMDSKIEAARLAVLGLGRLLSGLSRSLRAGVVTYCGPQKFPGGAIALGDLAPGRVRLRRLLGELRIGGGQEGGGL